MVSVKGSALMKGGAQVSPVELDYACSLLVGENFSVR